MSRFGWAYVNDVITGSGGTPGGTDKAIQFASGSTFSGSTNFTFDYTTNTVRLTGTLYADTLIVSSSTIYKSGSTKFGDDSGDTHQFTGSLYNTTLISGSSAQFTTITSQGATITGSLLMSGTAYISEVDYIDFDVAASVPTYKQGRIYSDIDTGDLAYYLQYANQKLQIGQQTVVKVKNSTGSPISKGKVIHITGAVGDNPLIATASWENDNNSANTLGMLMSTVANGDFGYALLNGVITGVNTNPATYSEGQVVYLSSSGDYTNTTPIAPNHTVRLGQVLRAHATVGSIYIKIDNGYELDELHNILITSPSSGDLLTYNSSSALWTNTKSLTGSYTLTGSLSASSTITAASASFTKYVQFGTSLSDEAYFNASLKTNLQPATTNNVDLGGSSRYWNTGYITTLSSSAISSSVNIKTGELTATSVIVNGNISGSGNINGSGLQISGNGQFGSNLTVTGTVSASVGLQTAGAVTVGTNLTVNSSTTLRSGLIVSGSSTVSGTLTVLGTMSASFVNGNGTGITGINGANVNGVGNDWTLQFKEPVLGVLSSSANLTFTGSNLILTGSLYSTSAIKGGYIIYSSSVSIPSTSYFVGLNSTSGVLTASLLAANNYPQGQMLIFKDVGGYAGTNNMLVRASGSETIDGASGVSLTANSSSVSIISNGSNGFYIVGIV